MAIINIHEAKTQLFELIETAAQGEEVIITVDGKPVARLIPVNPASAPVPVKRKPGGMKGKIWMADDFDAPLPDEIQRAFEGR